MATPMATLIATKDEDILSSTHCRSTLLLHQENSAVLSCFCTSRLRVRSCCTLNGARHRSKMAATVHRCTSIQPLCTVSVFSSTFGLSIESVVVYSILL